MMKKNREMHVLSFIDYTMPLPPSILGKADVADAIWTKHVPACGLIDNESLRPSPSKIGDEVSDADRHDPYLDVLIGTKKDRVVAHLCCTIVGAIK